MLAHTTAPPHPESFHAEANEGDDSIMGVDVEEGVAEEMLTALASLELDFDDAMEFFSEGVWQTLVTD